MNNPNCDGGRCSSSKGEVRVLPHTNNPNHGNSILCRACLRHEISYRIERNKSLHEQAKYDLPDWEDLKVYENA